MRLRSWWEQTHTNFLTCLWQFRGWETMLKHGNMAIDDQEDSTTAQLPAQQPLAHAQERARAQGVLGRTCLIGALIIISLVGMMAVLVSFICGVHRCTRGSNRLLMSAAPLSTVLTISQVVSHVAPFTVPFVMGLFAFQIGAEWLRFSTNLDANRPSPLQCALFFSASIAYMRLTQRAQVRAAFEAM
jgi:hypothetical protein